MPVELQKVLPEADIFPDQNELDENVDGNDSSRSPSKDKSALPDDSNSTDSAVETLPLGKRNFKGPKVSSVVKVDGNQKYTIFKKQQTLVEQRPPSPRDDTNMPPASYGEVAQPAGEESPGGKMEIDDERQKDEDPDETNVTLSPTVDKSSVSDKSADSEDENQLINFQFVKTSHTPLVSSAELEKFDDQFLVGDTSRSTDSSDSSSGSESSEDSDEESSGSSKCAFYGDYGDEVNRDAKETQRSTTTNESPGGDSVAQAEDEETSQKDLNVTAPGRIKTSMMTSSPEAGPSNMASSLRSPKIDAAGIHTSFVSASDSSVDENEPTISLAKLELMAKRMQGNASSSQTHDERDTDEEQERTTRHGGDNNRRTVSPEGRGNTPPPQDQNWSKEEVNAFVTSNFGTLRDRLNSEEEYEIEELMACGQNKQRRRIWLVKWVGWDGLTWEKADNISLALRKQWINENPNAPVMKITEQEIEARKKACKKR
ncbi:dentin sialophosphoprotein [Diachasma alloeum]|uniref:dentin sialophosphoprotein n=1 Tax=Diachasma alloeum TaxID=454923 RepID=UPI000738138E|nr:dentin sialophosphoprotein [Diachasma alloeum]XP_015120026.1 dentin sialophosphoprotein [Diachasma alloeum]